MKSIKFNEYVKNVKGVLKYEEPNANMHVFNGRLKLENFPRASDITDENFIMRGSTIKNVPLIYGLVVYAGMDTKIMQTLKFSSTNNENQNAMSYRHSTSGEGDIAIIKKNRDATGGMITLKRNEDYYGKVPNIETVVYRTVSDETTKATMLQSGEADLAWLNSNYASQLQRIRPATAMPTQFL